MGKKHSEYVIWVNLKLYDLLMITSPNLLNVQLWGFEVPLPTAISNFSLSQLSLELEVHAWFTESAKLGSF